jgi:glycosyltransferase involved in cell wall biosynthesis
MMSEVTLIMNAQANEHAHARPVPSVAVVTPCKATFFKPLFEAFAQAQPSPWKTYMVWPASHQSEHPQELITPVADNLEIRRVASQKVAQTSNPILNPLWRENRRRYFPSRELWRTLDEIAPRMIIVQEYSPFALGGLLYAKWHRLPVVTFTEVGARNESIFRPHVRLWHGFWSLWVKGIMAACPTAHLPISRRKIPSVAVYHAVDSRLYLPIEKETEDTAVTFVYVGQLIPRKGLDLWIKSLVELKKVHSNFKLRIIGGGDDNWVRGLITEAGLEAQIEWCGFLSGEALREAIRTADVFVLPSRQDTYAVVTHEAACLGLPLLVSKQAGSAEAVVREGENGFVIDPDATDEFTKKMALMLDATRRKAMSICSRKIGEEMSAHRRGAELWHWMEQFLSSSQK